MPKKPARNYMIDLIRFVLCVMIVFIHCPFPGPVRPYIAILGRAGVPFFLILSGWFSYHPDRDTMLRRSKKKLLDTLKLLGSFAVAYGIMNSITSVISGQAPWAWIGAYWNIRTLTELVLFNRALFFGSTAYYTFILIYVYIIFYGLVKLDLVTKACFLVPVLLAASICMGEFTDIPWIYYGNYLFTGLPFFLLGHWLHRNEALLRKGNALWGWLLLGGAISACLEARFIKSSYCYWGSVAMAVSLFALAMNSMLQVRHPAVVDCLQRCSVWIFIVHCGVRDILSAVMERFHMTCPRFLLAMLVLTISVLIGMAVHWFAAGRARRKGSAAR